MCCKTILLLILLPNQFMFQDKMLTTRCARVSIAEVGGARAPGPLLVRTEGCRCRPGRVGLKGWAWVRLGRGSWRRSLAGTFAVPVAAQEGRDFARLGRGGRFRVTSVEGADSRPAVRRAVGAAAVSLRRRRRLSRLCGREWSASVEGSGSAVGSGCGLLPWCLVRAAAICQRLPVPGVLWTLGGPRGPYLKREGGCQDQIARDRRWLIPLVRGEMTTRGSWVFAAILSMPHQRRYGRGELDEGHFWRPWRLAEAPLLEYGL
ncbi:hypothetical protein NDU88_003891 [Pleurodeles waltl]|uniref:Secreted protein n=1 Tax=Pleurodeles waltl TaxID=8319 RepID=A0AAV7M6N0_PLEWA|nr:hypothetical protein NDU88_003891 [Pleurodeles waltl]